MYYYYINTVHHKNIINATEANKWYKFYTVIGWTGTKWLQKIEKKTGWHNITYFTQFKYAFYNVYKNIYCTTFYYCPHTSN